METLKGSLHPGTGMLLLGWDEEVSGNVSEYYTLNTFSLHLLFLMESDVWKTLKKPELHLDCPLE